MSDGPGPLPRLGIRLHGGLPPGRCVELAQMAENAGFASVWFAENPFQRGVLPAASASAAATSRVRIGLGVVNPYNRHPTLMAMEIGALDELAGGRAVLGIGSGIGAAVERMGFDYGRPIAAVHDAVLIVRGLLAGETVDYAGRAFSAHGVALDYAPPRPDVPILVAGRGDQSLRLCGRVADGLIISNMCPPGFTEHAAGIVRDAAHTAGTPPLDEVVQYVPCVVRPDRAEAMRAAKEMLGEMLPGFWALGERLPAARQAMLRDDGIDAKVIADAVAWLEDGVPAAEAVDDRIVAAFAIAGTAEECLDQVRAYARAGVTEMVLSFAGETPAEDMEYLAAALYG